MLRIILFVIVFTNVFIDAQALQVKTVRDNQKVESIISNNELNRIFVNDDRIQTTHGLNGAYDLMKDEKQGAIFIKPTGFFKERGFNLFITTEKGHNYNLFLIPKTIPAETIEIKSAIPAIHFAEKWEKNSPYIDKLVQLIHEMTNNTTPDGYATLHLQKEKPKCLSNGLTMRLIKLYKGSHLKGEIWVLKNNKKESLYLKPQYFYRDKALAITITTEVLDPNEETLLYRVVSHD